MRKYQEWILRQIGEICDDVDEYRNLIDENAELFKDFVIFNLDLELLTGDMGINRSLNPM